MGRGDVMKTSGPPVRGAYDGMKCNTARVVPFSMLPGLLIIILCIQKKIISQQPITQFTKFNNLHISTDSKEYDYFIYFVMRVTINKI